MLSFEEFTESFPTAHCCRGSHTAKKIYSYISKNDTRIKLCKYADLHITPLSAICDEVLIIANQENSDFKLESKLHRQTVGRMVTEALREFGYIPATRARVIGSNANNPFSTAVTYNNNGEGQLYIYSEIRRRS